MTQTNSSSQPNPSSEANPSTHTDAQRGYPRLAIIRIREAQILNRWVIRLIYVAIIAFVLFGTLASLSRFRDSQWVYWGFHYLPYLLVAVGIPASLYTAWILYRYRLSQPSMLVLAVVVATATFILSTYVALVAWIGVAFLFKANLTRFFRFLQAGAP